MSGQILRFAPRGTVQVERPDLPPPPTLLKRGFFKGNLSSVEFIGTKEFLVAWGIALETSSRRAATGSSTTTASGQSKGAFTTARLRITLR